MEGESMSMSANVPDARWVKPVLIVSGVLLAVGVAGSVFVIAWMLAGR